MGLTTGSKAVPILPIAECCHFACWDCCSSIPASVSSLRVGKLLIAQSMIDEIMTKSYDAATVSAKVFSGSDFTAAGGLGCSGAEASVVPTPDAYPFKSVYGYNDVDDYHEYTRIATTPRMGEFQVTDTVFYVLETSPDTESFTQTFHKKVVVTVRHPNMFSPLQLSDVAAYRRYF